MSNNQFNKQTSKVFIDKNASLISFNKRILERLKQDDFPIFEKLRFCSIIDNNINELSSIKLKEDIGLMDEIINLKS